MPPRDSASTKQRILDAAKASVLERGFGGTSIDHVLELTGLTKGAFFYHYPTKDALAAALMARFGTHLREFLQDKLRRACGLSRDPLQRLLLLVGLCIEEEESNPAPDSSEGCLAAAYGYQQAVLPEAAVATAREATQSWAEMLAPLVEECAARYPPRSDVDLASLSEQLLTIYEGAMVLAKLHGDRAIVAAQLRQFRNYLELLFAPDDRGAG